jgi:hypothetical protein
MIAFDIAILKEENHHSEAQLDKESISPYKQDDSRFVKAANMSVLRASGLETGNGFCHL